MSDFAKFCPKCYAFFHDPDSFAKHVETCGVAKKNAVKETAGKTADSRQRTAAEKKATDRKRQTAAEKNQEQGVRSQSTEHTNEQNGAGNESPDSLSPDVSSAVSTEGSVPSADSAPKAKSPKFKT